MMLWIGLAGVTLGVLALLWLPFRRRLAKPVDPVAFDRRLYRARLREIDSDLALGRIGQAEAEAAKAEEGRKLIGLAGSARELPAASLSSRAILVAVSLFIPVFSLAAYLWLGVPAMPDMAAATRTDRDVARQSIEQLLQRAEAQLARNPSDVRGWTVVAPVYMRLGRADDAVHAWRNALRLQPDNDEYRLNLAEALTVAADGVVSEEARREFEKVLASRSDNPRARFYLAIALNQQGDYAAAAAAWRELVAQAPAEASWLPVARAQLAEAEARLTGRVVGPSKKDVDAAGQMSAGERQSMIEGMVASLSDKLQKDPTDKDGWKRLIRSYAVLGKPDEMAKALESAKKNNGDDAAFVAEIELIARNPDGEASQ